MLEIFCEKLTALVCFYFCRISHIISAHRGKIDCSLELSAGRVSPRSCSARIRWEECGARGQGPGCVSRAASVKTLTHIYHSHQYCQHPAPAAANILFKVPTFHLHISAPRRTSYLPAAAQLRTRVPKFSHWFWQSMSRLLKNTQYSILGAY